jgi:hypothetical protein
VAGPAADLTPGTEAEFVTEHDWGYMRQRDGGMLEYVAAGSALNAHVDARIA